MMRVKKTLFPKTGNDDILKISTNIKNFNVKIQDEIKNMDKVINDNVKIINSTKKECQKLCQVQRNTSTGTGTFAKRGRINTTAGTKMTL